MIRKVGLVRFDVSVFEPFFHVDPENDLTTDLFLPEGDSTMVAAAFVALDEPLDGATLARIAAMPGAGVSGLCYPVESDGARSIGTLFDAIGSPLHAGQVLTVARATGSWFELTEIDDGLDAPFYSVNDNYGFGIEGHVEAGTTIDVPGDAFPAFTAIEVPAMPALHDVVDDESEVRWRAGADSHVPVVIDVRFEDYVMFQPAEIGIDGSVTDVSTRPIRTLVEAPVDMRCVTRDTGRFAFPDALRATMEGFRAAGQAVADQIVAGSDLEEDAGGSIDSDGSLTDLDEILVEQGTFIDVSRVATRYRVEGDALLIVQSSNGGTL